MLRIFALFSFLLVFMIENNMAQDLEYTIFRGDDNIGLIQVSRSKNSQQEKISIKSEASFKILWKTHIRKSDFEVVFVNDTLHYSLMKTILNDELDKKAETKTVKGQYHCLDFPEDKHILDRDFSYSSAKLYYKEPIGVDRVYSESYLELCPLVKEKEGTYKLTLPGGKENFYTYKNGMLEEVLVSRTWFNITFKRTN